MASIGVSSFVVSWFRGFAFRDFVFRAQLVVFFVIEERSNNAAGREHVIDEPGDGRGADIQARIHHVVPALRLKKPGGFKCPRRKP